MKYSVFAFAALLVAFSCKDSSPQPPQPNSPDTTSHNFAWQIDTLGVTSSVLYDVAIINDTLAYAVGEMYLRDSTGQIDPQAWNAAKWNGQRWELLRIQFYTFCGQSGTGSYPAKAVFAFSPQEVWIAMGGSQVVGWNGQSQSAPMCTPVSINKLWGESPSSVYAVGNGGGIAHYNGSTWQRVESGTNTSLNDIWGTVEQTSRKRTVLVAASNRYSAGEKKLLSIDDTSRVDTLSWSPGSRVNTVWFLSSSKIYGGGSGLFVGTSGAWQQIFELPSIYITRIRGTAENDVWVVGAFGLCAHFNGATWKTYSEVALPNGSYEGLAVTSKLIIAVGYVGNRAVALRGRK